MKALFNKTLLIGIVIVCAQPALAMKRNKNSKLPSGSNLSGFIQGIDSILSLVCALYRIQTSLPVARPQIHSNQERYFTLQSMEGDTAHFPLSQLEALTNLSPVIGEMVSELIESSYDLDNPIPIPNLEITSLLLLVDLLSGVQDIHAIQFSREQIRALREQAHHFRSKALSLVADLAETNAKEYKATNEFLSTSYTHYTVPEQLDNYVKIYNEAYTSDPRLSGPIPGLYDILDNLFSLINYSISDDSEPFRDAEQGITTLRDKAFFLEHLSMFRNLVASRFSERSPSSLEFQKIVGILVELLSSYRFQRHKQCELFNLHPLKWGPAGEGLLDPLLKAAEKSETYSAPTYIVAGLPERRSGRTIAPAHFVRQYFQNDYRAYLIFLDVVSDPKIKEANDPHDSSYNGVDSMYEHDRDHQGNLYGRLKDAKLHTMLKKIYQISEKYSKYRHYNEDAVLINGLFLFIHESTSAIRAVFYKRTEWDLKTFVRALCEEYKSDLKFTAPGIFPTFASDLYNHLYRDWEYIVRSKVGPSRTKPIHDRKGTPFYIEGQNKEESLEKAYARFFDYFYELVINALESEAC